jgi:hypothetical protein
MSILLQITSALLILAGLLLVGFGNSWAPFVLDTLPASELGLWIELVVPFLPIAIIGMGAALFTLKR